VEKALGDIKLRYEKVKATRRSQAIARSRSRCGITTLTFIRFTPNEIVHGFRKGMYLDLNVPAGFESHLSVREQELHEYAPALVRLRREEPNTPYQER
jgi:hypothetical protein